MPATAIQFQLNPAFVLMLKQQPSGSASLDSELRAIRTVFTQQEDALRRGSNVGVSVLPTVEQTDSLLANLQDNSHQWNERLQTGLTGLTADFGQFCQTIDQQAGNATVQDAWARSVNTARAVGDELDQLSGQVTATYLKLPDQERQLNALAQIVTNQLYASRQQVQQTQQDMDEQQRKIDKVKRDEEIASYFVGSAIADSLGDLFTGMSDMQNRMNDLRQQVAGQEQVANGLNQYAAALSTLTGNLQTFTQHYADVSSQWRALSIDMNNCTDALANRIHTDSPFFGPQVKAAADDLNTVLGLFAAMPAA